MRSPNRAGALRDLLRISRPRFWLYLGGTYLVGYTAGATGPAAFLAPLFVAALAYFLIPANVFLYGVNDLFDVDTDRHNPKKGDREHRLATSDRRAVAWSVVVSAGLGVGLALVLPSAAEKGFLLAFLVLGAAYSAPPFRLKARPVVDSASNVLYAMPGFLGYAQSSGALPPVAAVVGAAAWTAAMHLFSAVPDIEADRAAGLRTTAVVLGSRGALLACAALWTVAAASAVGLLGDHRLGWVAWVAFVYPAIPLLLLHSPSRAARVYWMYPALNAVFGFGLFLLAATKAAGR